MGCNQAKIVSHNIPSLPSPHRQSSPNPSANPLGTVILDIPVRLQWQNGHGYCGETSIQCCSLFYGNYISASLIRKIAGSQVLLGENAQETIGRLGYEYEAWGEQNHNQGYRGYLQWVKKNILKGYPVIVCGYDEQGQEEEYDHIFLAVGVKSQSVQQYNDHDELVYMDHFEKDYIVTAFGKIWDNRDMKRNGKNLDFAIPQKGNFGIAITGIKDPEEQFLPVKIQVDQNTQPNVTLGKQSDEFELKISISELQAGKKYALLRYDNFKHLPQKHVLEGQASKVKRFIAAGNEHNLIDSVDSASCAFFRCVQEEDLE